MKSKIEYKILLTFLMFLSMQFLSAIAQAAPFAFTAPTAASTLQEHSSVTITWTGGNPASNVNLSIIDVASFTVVGSVAGNIANSGARIYTFANSLTCGKKYQFYIEDVARTMWQYGPVFMLSCLSTGAISVPTNPPSGRCATQVLVTNIHYPNQTCAQTIPSFLANVMTMFHFKSKCPTGSQLLGVLNVSCQNAPIPGFSNGSVYQGTACCGLRLSQYYLTRDSYNSIFTPAQVQVYAKNRADSECKTKHGLISSSYDVIVTNITTNAALHETYDDRKFNCILP